MLISTLQYLRCPQRKRKIACGSELTCDSAGETIEVWYGTLTCALCNANYPILAGVAIVVEDVESYILHHVKGISKVVPDAKIPAAYRKQFAALKKELKHSEEHIEEDLESERVTALYLMNHYLRVNEKKTQWWKPEQGAFSPLIDQLVREYWDQGPFFHIEKWVRGLSEMSKKKITAVELGCGVGGLFSLLQPHLHSYLGVDSSFASIALARHLNLGAPYPEKIKVPGDLLLGTVSRAVDFPSPVLTGSCTVDFVVGDLERPALQIGTWDLSLVLNAIDMLEEPADLPRLQHELVRAGGWAIQSAPYIWHQKIAKKIRSLLPEKIKDSASAAESLYQKAGFKIEKRLDHVPWLFFKHVRQLEVYSVHLFWGRKG